MFFPCHRGAGHLDQRRVVPHNALGGLVPATFASNGLRGSDRKYRLATGRPFQRSMASSALLSDLVRWRRFAGLHEHFRLAPIHYISFACRDERFDGENHLLPEARATELGAVGYLKAGVKLPSSEAVPCEVVYGLVTPSGR